MWQTDTVTLQTAVTVDNFGVKTKTWSPSETVTCDVQDINKELVYKEYGFTENVEYKQVFDHTLNANWAIGDQVAFDGEQWRIRLVNRQLAKMGGSNHVYVILSKVI